MQLWIHRWNKCLDFISGDLKPFLDSKICNFQLQFFFSLFSDCAEGLISEEAKNQEMSEWLWKVSEKWTGLTFNTNKIY